MKENSRIRFNPTTKEVEIEGSEKFINSYFGKIQEILFGMGRSEGQKPALLVRSSRKKRTEEALPVRKKGLEKEEGARAPRLTLFDKVVGLIQGSNGITTSEIKQKTGLTEKQIWSITYRGEKLGKIKKSKRGVYESAG